MAASAGDVDDNDDCPDQRDLPHPAARHNGEAAVLSRKQHVKGCRKAGCYRPDAYHEGHRAA